MTIKPRATVTPPPVGKPPAKPEGGKFNYNAQDPSVVDNGSKDIPGTVAKDGQVETDAVELDNKKAVFGPFGRLRDIKDDPDFKLSPNADGTFVFPVGHDSATASNVVGVVSDTVNKFNQVSEELTGKRIDWAFKNDKLKVSPETGEWPNAFYARQLEGVHFFDYKGQSTGDSGEVASHEAGHAILDAIRPGYFSGVGAETGAFHEAFGDALAMLMTLGDGAAVDKIVAQTEGGDLSAKRNALADMGEGFGAALGLGRNGIRTSFNKFTYKDPATLPERGDENNLGHEVHDFSRLWSGAFYDVLDGIADANREAGMNPKEALMAAGEEGWKLLIGQMDSSSAGNDTTFKEMAAAMVEGDKKFNGGARQELIKNVMVKRELMTPEAAGDIFKSDQPVFSGNVVAKEVTLGSEFGILNGVSLETKVDQPTFSAFNQESAPALTDNQATGIKQMLANDQILFTEKAEPAFGDLFKEDGTAYKAYVSTDENGNKSLHKVAMAVCNHGHSHEGEADEHGHIHH